jgi:hypothetical protein
MVRTIAVPDDASIAVPHELVVVSSVDGLAEDGGDCGIVVDDADPDCADRRCHQGSVLTARPRSANAMRAIRVGASGRRRRLRCRLRSSEERDRDCGSERGEYGSVRNAAWRPSFNTTVGSAPGFAVS